jgi:hypothetical protein
MVPMKIEIIKDVDACKKLWMEFSPNKSIYDLWDFRFLFWKIFQYPLHFIVLKNGAENSGLLPLWYVADKNAYFWFGDTGDGSNWQEDTNFWVKDDIYLPALLGALPGRIALYNIAAECFDAAKNIIEFQRHNPKNILGLETFHSVEDYLLTLKGKLRSNLKRDRRIIDSQNPTILIDNFPDFDHLIRLNIERNEDSVFQDLKNIEIFREIIKKGLDKTTFQVRMLSIYINNQPVGVDLILIFNNIYYTMACGYDIQNCSGIGNYLNLLDIQDAIALGIKKIDFSEGGDDAYKNKLFPVIPQYKIETLPA